MGRLVRVQRPVEYDPGVVARVLGDVPLPVHDPDRVLAPFLTIDGRIHTPTSDFLRQYCLSRPNLASARRIASDLAGWVEFLCNDCALEPFEDARDPVLQATEQHFARYYRLRQYSPDDKRALTPEGWAHAASSLKRLYEFMQRRYQHPPPFDIVAFVHRDGFRGTKIEKYQPRRRNSGSAGRPLTPEFTELLLQGALRIDANGQQEEYRGADRDHAIISLALASGLRRNNLANITVHELPLLSALPITTMRVADRITKNDAGGDALVFTHRLRTVHQYLTGPRADIAARKPYRPAKPLHVVAADSTTVRWRAEENADVTSCRWADVDASLRRRLVEQDGSSPVLFLNEYTGAPLSYSSYQHTVDEAATFARERINKSFPDPLRLHDLRHTYAVHLTIAIYRGVIAKAVDPERRQDWTVDHLAAAVELVRFSLGHASEASTRLYIQTAHRFLGIPVEQFLGEF